MIKGAFAFECADVTFNICRFLRRAVESETRGRVGGGGGCSTGKDIRLEILKFPGLLERLIQAATEVPGGKVGAGQVDEVETLRATSQSLRLESPHPNRSAAVVVGDSRSASRVGTAATDATGTRRVSMGGEIGCVVGNGGDVGGGGGGGGEYSVFIKEEMARMKEAEPLLPNKQAFVRAVGEWVAERARERETAERIRNHFQEMEPKKPSCSKDDQGGGGVGGYPSVSMNNEQGGVGGGNEGVSDDRAKLEAYLVCVGVCMCVFVCVCVCVCVYTHFL